MQLTGGLPYWLVNDGLPYHYPRLSGRRTTSVAIIGGGITGTLAAYQFICAGIPCILVDRRSIGLGSTCASTSLLQYELDTPLHRLIKMTGRHRAVRAYQLCGEAIGALLRIMGRIGYDEYERNGSLLYTRHRNEITGMKEESMARKAAGFEVGEMNRDELLEKYGLKAWYGIHSELGASINTYSLTHNLLQYCMNRGLEVYDRTEVVKLSANNKGVKLETLYGDIRAGYAINATGYEVVKFIGKKIVDFDCTYAIASEHQSEQELLWRDRVLLWNTDVPYLYMRLTDDNRLMAGGRDLPVSNKASRLLMVRDRAVQLEKDVRQALPGINFKTEFAWSGTFGKTKDSLPYIGSLPGAPRVLYALGFGGNGITFGQMAAEMLCDKVTGRKNRDASLFGFGR